MNWKDKKINIGCGEDIREGYINIDIRDVKGIDLISDVFDLQIPPNSLQEIYASDFLEHFSEKEGKQIINLFYKWLKPQGSLFLRVPDLKEVSKKIIEEPFNKDLVYRLYGGQDYNTNFHKWGWTPESLKKILMNKGFFIMTDNRCHWNIELNMIKQ